jgi:hypothetical protein
MSLHLPNDVPRLDRDLSNRTDWFPRDISPVHVGWYECRYWSDRYRKWGLEVARWWDGHAFKFGPGEEDVASDFGSHLYDQWRGRVWP